MSRLPPKIPVSTQRLYLREMTLKDVDNLQLIFNDPVAMQYYPKTLNIQETKDWIQNTLEDYQKHGVSLWACHKRDTDEFVGQCGLIFRDHLDGRDEVEIGYLFVRKFWNQGFATEAAKGCMDYADAELGLRRVISLIRPINQASRRVAVKNGFVAEKEIEFYGQIHIVYVYHFKDPMPHSQP